MRNGKEPPIRRLKNQMTPVNVYCVAAVLGLVVILLCFFFSRGDLLERYFFYDTRDAGMDFFHSIEYVNGREPYKVFGTLYPPLANLFFYILLHFIPKRVSDLWPKDFNQSVAMRGTEHDLRVHQAPFLIFLAFIVVTSVLLAFLMATVMRKRGHFRGNLAAFCMVLGPGVLFAIDRGNVLFLTVLLTLFYVYYRNSDNKILQELSLLALAVAAGIKLYPAFFGILLLRDKQYKRAARAVFYGVLSVILPALCFKEGLSAISMWLSVLFRFGGNESSMPWVGLGFSSILHRIALYLKEYLHIKIGTGWFSIAGYVIALLMLLSSVLMKKQWQSMLATTTAMILFQPQGSYILSFMCIPLVYFLVAEDKFSKENACPFMVMALLTVHLPLFYTRNVTYPNFVVYQLVLLISLAWCAVVTIINLSNWRKNKHVELED